MVVILLHDTLYGFLTGRGMGAAFLKAKLLQNPMDMREEIIYEIFLDLHKLYDSLYSGLSLDILAVYGIESQALRLIRHYWDQIIMVVRIGGYFGAPFKGQLSVTQGNPIPPMMFNPVVDEVLQHWVSVVAEVGGSLRLDMYPNPAKYIKKNP